MAAKKYEFKKREDKLDEVYEIKDGAETLLGEAHHEHNSLMSIGNVYISDVYVVNGANPQYYIGYHTRSGTQWEPYEKFTAETVAEKNERERPFREEKAAVEERKRIEEERILTDKKDKYNKYYNYFLALDNPTGRNSYLQYPYDGMTSGLRSISLDELRTKFVQLNLLYPKTKEGGYIKADTFLKNDAELFKLLQLYYPTLKIPIGKDIRTHVLFYQWLQSYKVSTGEYVALQDKYDKNDSFAKIRYPTVISQFDNYRPAEERQFYTWLIDYFDKNDFKKFIPDFLESLYTEQYTLFRPSAIDYIKTKLGVDGYDFLLLTFIHAVKNAGYTRLARALCTNETSGLQKITENDTILTTSILGGPGIPKRSSLRFMACGVEGGARRTRRKVRKSRKARKYRKAKKQSRRSK